ncbi:hypothetical protein ACH47C_03585 [Streptomyces rishiriensis]|uniref:hypothetical protein n=1 Tax=Streptomyces rishiriensis TaxID=68264 RepID=UPI0033FE69C7
MDGGLAVAPARVRRGRGPAGPAPAAAPLLTPARGPALRPIAFGFALAVVTLVAVLAVLAVVTLVSVLAEVTGFVAGVVSVAPDHRLATAGRVRFGRVRLRVVPLRLRVVPLRLRLVPLRLRVVQLRLRLVRGRRIRA